MPYLLSVEGQSASTTIRSVLVLTFTAKDYRNVPELGHVESLKDLTLVACSVSVQREGDVFFAHVLIGKGDTSTDRDLCADDTVSSVEAGREHVHRSAFAVSNTLSPSEQFTDDRAHGSSAHHRKTVTSVCGDEMILLGDGVFDPDGDSFLSGRQMAETSNLLFFVKSVCCHFHSSER